MPMSVSMGSPVLDQEQAEAQDGHPPASQSLLDSMRAYRACLNCRNRKSKCDLDPNGGKPPCRRCTRENKECVLGESHRGGRRIRKKARLDRGSMSSRASSSQDPTLQPPGQPEMYSPITQSQQLPLQNPYPPMYENRIDGFSWQQPGPESSSSDSRSLLKDTRDTSISSPSNGHHFGPRRESAMGLLNSAEPGRRSAIQYGLAPANLQNPSDALEILAHVADRAEGESPPLNQRGAYKQELLHQMDHQRDQSRLEKIDDFAYKPIQDGLISPHLIYQYFSSYEQFFHPFFPVIPRETFDRARLPWISRHEPYLFSAILTIASKDDERIHQICYDHMQSLLAMILAGADANIDSVEALLLLSQWVSHRPQASTAVGRGEEDRVVWMYIGTALRVAYFLGIDKTSFRSGVNDDSVEYHRKRLVWAACYICDRQVTVRLGKGFWARGPGPLSGLRAIDFPTLQPRSQSEDNLAVVFQANLELTQIFSNVHDILYSSKDEGWQEMLKGRYAKYLDDFRSSIRSWNETWGNLRCSLHLKASLDLTFDYLRLYVNAFAYQATISRALIFQRDSQHKPNRSVPLIDASAPDARFIYEALDAAKSLLTTFTNSVDQETLRYMPVSYYLFVIYSAVFLYKARLTTTMSEEERTAVPELISHTIERLQSASRDKSHMGSRYARLLQLLWRKAPPRPSPHPTPSNLLENPLLAPPTQRQSQSQNQNQTTQFDPKFDPNQFSHMAPFQAPPPPQQNNAFSWLDLGATWNFATQNNSVSGGSLGEMDDALIDPDLSSPYDMGMLPDYSYLEGDNANFIF